MGLNIGGDRYASIDPRVRGARLFGIRAAILGRLLLRLGALSTVVTVKWHDVRAAATRSY